VSDSDKKQAVELMPALSAIARELDIYAELLLRWQNKINLVGPSTTSRLWTRHFADSVQLLEIVSANACWADLGSGGGFPGLVVSIAQKAGTGDMHLIESDVRKAAFLREVSRETGARAIVHVGRCEDVLPSLTLDVISSRAMTNLTSLIEMSRAHVEKGATGLFLKGRDVGVELTQASTSCNFNMVSIPSRIEPNSFIVRVSSS
jgi:16S rRNA (guanine527-N7)-methyltransferase